MKEIIKMTDEIYNKMKRDSLKAEQDETKWDIIKKNEKNIKCNTFRN